MRYCVRGSGGVCGESGRSIVSSRPAHGVPGKTNAGRVRGICWGGAGVGRRWCCKGKAGAGRGRMVATQWVEIPGGVRVCGGRPPSFILLARQQCQSRRRVKEKAGGDARRRQARARQRRVAGAGAQGARWGRRNERSAAQVRRREGDPVGACRKARDSVRERGVQCRERCAREEW